MKEEHTACENMLQIEIYKQKRKKKKKDHNKYVKKINLITNHHHHVFVISKEGIKTNKQIIIIKINEVSGN